MVRKFVTATVSAALCATAIMPGVAVAQEYRFAGFDAPQGLTATVNLRVPLGRERAPRPSYGFTLGYGRTMGGGLDGRLSTRAVNFTDIRFRDDGLHQARIAGIDLARPDLDNRMNLVGPGKKTWLVIGGIVVAGVLICLAADCFGGDDDEDSNPSTPG